MFEKQVNVYLKICFTSLLFIATVLNLHRYFFTLGKFVTLYHVPCDAPKDYKL